MSKRNKENQIKNFLKTVSANKKMVLLIEVVLAIVFGVLFGIGIYYNNIFLEGFCSNCFTALLVTLLSTLIRWNQDEEEEKAAKYMEEKIADLEEYKNCLEQHTESLSKQIDVLSKAMINYKGKECIFCKSYVKGVKLNRAQCDWHSYFSNAKKEISILVTNLRTLTGFEEDLRAAAKRGVNVRILTMHPDFAVEFNHTRAVDSLSRKQRWLSMKDSLCYFLDETEQTENFEVRAYTKLAPTLILFIVDNSCYVAHLLNGQETKNSAHYLFGDENNADTNDSTNMSPVKSFKQHFEYAWSYDGTASFKYEDISVLELPAEYQD